MSRHCRAGPCSGSLVCGLRRRGQFHVGALRVTAPIRSSRYKCFCGYRCRDKDSAQLGGGAVQRSWLLRERCIVDVSEFVTRTHQWVLATSAIRDRVTDTSSFGTTCSHMPRHIIQIPDPTSHSFHIIKWNCGRREVRDHGKLSGGACYGGPCCVGRTLRCGGSVTLGVQALRSHVCGDEARCGCTLDAGGRHAGVC